MKIPSTHQVIMPYFIVDGVEQFIEFVTFVFAAVITYQGKNKDGSIGHCELQIGGYTIMFSGSTDTWKARTCDLFVYVEDADETFTKAIKAGATIEMELADQPYGRSGGVRDRFGNVWWITTVK